MAEVREESTHVLSHRQRIAVFLAAMRHFAVELWDQGYSLSYRVLNDEDSFTSLGQKLLADLQALKPREVQVVLPGDHRVLQQLEAVCKQSAVPLLVLDDQHFTVQPRDYDKYLGKKSSTRMEFFYRWQRQRLEILMDGKQPLLGRWNFDSENREAVKDPEDRASIPQRLDFPPDAITEEVLQLVAEEFPTHPGDLKSFAWPVTPEQGKKALECFLQHRLGKFGRYQDAMVTGQAWMWHSHISVALNLKLLPVMDCVRSAERLYHEGKAPIESVEGFIRQIIGWREFIRCVYYHEGPDYGTRNGLNMVGRLPEIYWTGQTSMKCMAECLGQTLEHGYAHHIQRLMVTGNFALIAGVHPREISDWYLAIYVDAIDWVTLPNTLGMVMHADGGIVGSKPYAASGRYIQRQSDYCKGCKYDPGTRLGPKACPFTTFYWDFLIRYRVMLGKNPRTATILKNLDRFGEEECSKIQEQANDLRRELGITA
jgi:deoxyribodipyrimidine photolyase-related protein